MLPSPLAAASTLLAQTPVDLSAVLGHLCEELGADGASLVRGTDLSARRLASAGTVGRRTYVVELPTSTTVALHYARSEAVDDAQMAPWVGLLTAALAKSDAEAGDVTLRLYEAGTLLRAIGHDVKNIINAYNAYVKFAESNLAEWGIPKDSEVFDDLAQIGTASTRISVFIRRMHELAYILQGPWDPTPASDVLGASAQQFGTNAWDAVRVTVNVLPDLPDVRIDGVHARLVIGELVANAKEAGANRIAVSVGRPDPHDAVVGSWCQGLADGEWVVLRCDDNGVGMDALTMYRIMEPLFKIPADAEKPGLGLNLIAATLQAVGARMLIYSARSLDSGAKMAAGTTVAIALPAAHVTALGGAGSVALRVPDEVQPRVALAVWDPALLSWLRTALKAFNCREVSLEDDPHLFVSDLTGIGGYPGGQVGLVLMANGLPQGVPRPDAIMAPSPDLPGLARRMSMALTSRLRR